MPAQSLEIDLRGKSLDEVVQLLRKSGFSASSTEISLWSNCEKAARGEPPGPAVRVVWIEDDEENLLTVTAFDAKVTTLKPGLHLHLADRPEGLLPGQDWFVADTLQAFA